MTENNYDIDPLLVKVVLEEATDEELVQVREWVAQSAANGKYFADFKQIWEESRHLAVHSPVDENDAWADFQRRVQSEPGGVQGEPATPIIPLPRLRWLRVAAAVITLVAGGWLYYYNTRPEPFLSVFAGQQVLTDTLPEGSVVTLNKESSIRYKKNFAGATRGIEMQGEAFFSVAPDKAKPFVVQAGGASVTVLGTSFNVKIRPDSTEVIVETGMVEVQKGESHVKVRAHERAIISEHGTEVIKGNNPDRLYNYYRTNAFECDGIPLWRLVAKLNEVYTARIVIGNPRLKDLQLTTNFHDESLDTILAIIIKTYPEYHITTAKQGGDIIIK